MAEETLKILKMVEEKKVTAEEGARLLDALSGKKSGEGTTSSTPSSAYFPTSPTPPSPSRGRLFKIIIKEKGKEKPTVNVTLPLSLAQALKNLVPAEKLNKLENKGINLSSLEEAVKNMGDGPIRLVDIDDDDEKVEISIV